MIRRHTGMNQTNGRIDAAPGKVKPNTGKILVDPVLDTEGNIQENFGKSQACFKPFDEDTQEGR